MVFFEKCQKREGSLHLKEGSLHLTGVLGLGVILLALLAACIQGKEVSAMEEQRIVFATDLHYLSGSLTDQGEIFQTLMEKGDGKLTEYGGEILKELIQKALEEKASALVLAGDVTFNGEYQSLLDLREAFQKAEEEGLPVLLIPGNHDIAYPYACEYFGDRAKRVKAISQKDFAELMGDFGYHESPHKDGASYSYVYPLGEKDWLLFLDANTEAAPGKLKDETLYWMRETLAEAEKSGKRVTVICHQNILPHSSFMSAGFVLGNASQTADILRSGGVKLALTGHSHLQHTASEGGLTDICTESVSVAPLRYALVTFPEEGEVLYEKRDLPIRQQEARERFYQVVGRQVEKTLEKKNLTEAEKKSMVSLAQEVNLAYFSGYLDPKSVEAIKKGARWHLWTMKARDTFWYLYMNSYLG